MVRPAKNKARPGTLFIPPRRFDASKPEMIDLPDADPVLLRGELRNLRIINRRFGGRRALRKGLATLDGGATPQGVVAILDLGTGSGDQAMEAVRFFRSKGRKVSITAIDNNPEVLSEARRYIEGYDEIHLEERNILALPYADSSFDIVMCTLTAHHFSENGVVTLLKEMQRLSRTGFILIDLSRSYVALASAWIYTRLSTTNIMTKTDAMMSISAAFTMEEVFELAREAGIGNARISHEPFFLLSLMRRL